MRASRVFAAILCSGVLAVAVPAAAQTPTPAAPVVASAPVAATSGVEVGIIGGLGSVQNVGPMFGGQVTYRINQQFRVSGEGFWVKDAVTRARLNAIAGFATFLTNREGKTATAELVAPATYGGLAVQYLFPIKGSVHPYASAGAGLAKIVSQPKFTLGGADITTSLPTYGVTLGSDFAGEFTKFAITGGLGVIIERSRLSFDLGLRLTSVQTEGQKTNILRGQLGVAYKF